jgi:carbon storage regulator
MLVLSRKQTESIVINDNIVVTVLGVRGNMVRLGVEAPREMPVLRSELDRRQAIELPPKSPIPRPLRTLNGQAPWK